MTVLVGIRCTDGLVIGGDSATTSALGDGRPTVVQSATKIDIVDDNIVIAHTGQVGMGQRFNDIVSNVWTARELRGKSALDCARILSGKARQDFIATGANAGQYGALVGLRTNTAGLMLCEFAVSDFQPELKTEERLWYCSMGLGQAVVDPLFGLFRKAFWADGPPNLAGGIFAATWALELAIELCPAGVDGPIRLAVVDNNGARFLNDVELDGHRENCSQAIEYLSRYPHVFDNSDIDVPKPED